MLKRLVYSLIVLLLLSLSCDLYSQATTSHWKQIDSLMNLGLIESVLPEIEFQLVLAKQDRNVENHIKAVLLKLEAFNQKGAEINEIIELFEDEINESYFPVKSILHSLLAETYQNYYSQNRSKINRRSNLKSNDKKLDFWTAMDFKNVVKKYYLLSIKPKDSLYQYLTKEIDGILLGDFLSKKNNQRLYEILAKRCIAHFALEAKSIKKSNTHFTEFIRSYRAFSNLDLDSSANNLIALKGFQNLLRLQFSSGHIQTFIQTELERLKFVFKHYGSDEDSPHYINSLKELIASYPAHPQTSEIYYEIARIYCNRASKFNPKSNRVVQWEYQNAAKICRFVIDKFPNSDGSSLCELMLEKIETPFIGLDMKSGQLPNTPILASLSFRNCSNIYFKLIKLNYAEAQKTINFSRNFSNIEPYLNEIPFSVWQENLPRIEDYQKHNTQIRIPDLDLGFYLLLVSNSPSFDKSSQIHLSTFTVSELSLISKNDGLKGKIYFILNRRTGQPMQGVKLNLFRAKYNEAQKSYEHLLESSFISDKKGFIHIDEPKSNINQQQLILNSDTLYEGHVYFQHLPENEKEIIKTQFFTDRKIYRPGQIVYYKGITSKQINGNHLSVQNRTVTVKFRDVNAEIITSEKHITNNFGSYNGSFIIPQNSLNGRMYLSDEYGSHFIQVEEYKRPNFEILFDTLKEQYRTNDSIHISGFVKSFSGIPLGNTKLKYRVIRTDQRFDYRIVPLSEEKQIADGEQYTKLDGSFGIDFFASIDLKPNISDYRFYHYKLEVDILDINGETQSEILTIPLSNINLFLRSLNGDLINKQKTSGIPISAKNILGQKQDLNVFVSIFKLETPERSFKSRSWEKPDVFLGDQESFYTYFPNSQYANELNKDNWMISEQVYQAEINTGEQSEVEIFDFPYWKDGVYKMLIKAKDQFDEDVETIKYFTVFDPSSSSMPFKKMSWFVLDKNEYEVGDTCVFNIGSSAKGVSIYYEVQHDNEVLKRERLQIHNEQKSRYFLIDKSLIGDVSINIIFVKNNEIYRQTKTIRVLDSRKQIKIQLNTFRNYLAPNISEEWEIQISSASGFIQAELMAAMTDYSLEKILPYRWNLKFPRKFSRFNKWKSGTQFNLSFNRTFGKFAYRYFGEANNPIPYFFKKRVIRDGVFKIRGASSLKGGDVLYEIDVLAEVIDVSNELYQNTVLDKIPLRKNFKETVFFYPNLKTDRQGIIKLKFKSPESLSKWKVKLLAHTKDLRNAYLEKEIITQKELMLSPNLPRFMRVGDTLFFSTKISNLSEKEIVGDVKLQLFDAATDQKLYAVLIHNNASQRFIVGANASINRRWKIRVPENVAAIKYRLVASSENHSDGEERVLPVLSRQVLITESLPLFVSANEAKEVLFENLINSSSDSTLKHHQLKLDFTSNPIWHALLALPHIETDLKENSLSVFNRYFANKMAFQLLNSNPEIADIFKQLKVNNSQAMVSELSKNEDLKAILLQESPWLLDARNESEQRQRLALFFDKNTLKTSLDQNLNKLLSLQLADGSWCWYKGGRGSLYITQSILSGLVKLNNTASVKASQNKRLEQSIEKALAFLKRKNIRNYQNLKQEHTDYLDKDYLSASKIRFLYILSQINRGENGQNLDLAMSYYLNQAQRYWMNKSNYLQAMIAIIMHRKADVETANLITKSLFERSSFDKNMGRYWKDNNSHYWYNRSIETQAIIIEAFNEIGIDNKKIEELTHYLLNKKRTQLWESPKASVEAVNALLSGSTYSVKTPLKIQVSMAGRPIRFEESEIGTAYVQKRWEARNVRANLGMIQLKNRNSNAIWGALHWQYFQNIDSIKSASTGLKIEKELYLKVTDLEGDRLVAIDATHPINLGDRIVSRILISTDRDLDFVHLKDQRAAALEPTQILSSYQYQDGLSYYATTTDVATHYYFDEIRKGNYVIEIEMVATQLGSFSNGISSIQCLYAPEFNAHSNGQRMVVR